MKYLYLIFVLLAFNSCSTKEAPAQESLKSLTTEIVLKKAEYIADLKTIPQDVRYYTKNLKDSALFSQIEYEKSYFRVWNSKKVSISLDNAMWAHNAYKVGDTYGENLQLHSEEFFQNNLENANYKEFASVNKKALTLIRVNVRAFPTNRPVIRNPEFAGEGLPFDYLQNTAISPNKPLLVSHYSKDGEWAFVESSFAFGWVKSRQIAVIDDKYTQAWQKAQQVFLIKEGVPIYSEDATFLFKSRIGMMLALVEEDEEDYTVLTIGRYKNKKPLYIQSKISKSIAHKGVLEFNKKNINMIINEVSKTNYGWGGMYGQRDCSSILRNFYAPFGLWLPRNSSLQSKMGKVIHLDNASSSEKLALLKKEGLPFRTLVYKQGHIALYIGEYNGKSIIFQNVWGVKTKKDGIEGRFIIGRPIFSTLEVGKNLKEFDAEASMLAKLKSISTL